MPWLTRFIERNKFAWERRRATQERDKEEQEDFERWKSQGPKEQMEEMSPRRRRKGGGWTGISGQYGEDQTEVMS